ncbi:hypothetical protein [Glaciecola sp. 1036]|uniref:hypothetical protein n=1 Tax=Alteromonadaceae TaxID=72275 RepID=UPI003CFFE5E2
MNLEQMQSLWQDHSLKLEECISLNKRLLNEKQKEEQKSKLHNLVVSRTLEGALFFIICVALSKYIVSSWSLSAPVVSAVVLNVFAIVGLAGNIGQITLLNKIDFAKPIKQTLTDLIVVRSHNMQIFKLIMLSAPFYMAYVFLGYDIIYELDLYSLMSAETKIAFAVISLVFVVLVVVLITKLTPENRGNKIIDWLYREVSGEKLTHLLDEMENIDRAKR